jgi:hypothetical protein
MIDGCPRDGDREHESVYCLRHVPHVCGFSTSNTANSIPYASRPCGKTYLLTLHSTHAANAVYMAPLYMVDKLLPTPQEWGRWRGGRCASVQAVSCTLMLCFEHLKFVAHHHSIIVPAQSHATEAA